MRDRGKAVEDMEYYSTSHDLPCKKHPSSSSVGICAYCLKDRLVKLVCSDCGEQRLSSCSCSEISSNRNSCTVEVGSVGRVSFLIENENTTNKLKTQTNKTENNNNHELNLDENDAMFLRRSNSSCVEIKRRSNNNSSSSGNNNNNNGFWRFGKFFRRKKEKDQDHKSVSGFDDKNEMWLVDHMGVSRSRSLCSFRGGGGGGGGWFGSDDGARSSISGARSSSVTACMVLDSGRRSGFSETEPRKSGFDNSYYSDVGFVSENHQFGNGNRRVFSLKESDFNGMDESGFIDLKLDYSAESKPDHNQHLFCSNSESAFGSMRASSNISECYGGNYSSNYNHNYNYNNNNYNYNECENGVFSRAGSCRITVNDRGLKKGRKSLKGWRWIFRHHLGSHHGVKKDLDQDVMFKA